MIVKRSGAAISVAPEVEAYLGAVPEPARATLEALRGSVRAILPDAEEVISYQIPTFKHRGRAVVGYAAWKQHCSLYPYSGSVVEELREDLKGYDTNKGTIRFPHDRPLPAGLVKKIVRLRIKSIESR